MSIDWQITYTRSSLFKTQIFFFALSYWMVTGMTTVTLNSKPVSWLYITKLFRSPSYKSTN